MSYTLRKADGDLYIDHETGRGELVTGPTKVSQELFSLYASDYDSSRNWGSELSMKYFTNVGSNAQFRSLLYFKLFQANDRMLQKQADDNTLDETERITSFSFVNIAIDQNTNDALFRVIADVGDPTTQVGKTLWMTYKPVSLRHVVPMPTLETFNFG